MDSLIKILVILIMAFAVQNALAQSVSPHPVPEEFASDYYSVSVNGKYVPVFHAGLNVYFAGFDLFNNVKVNGKTIASEAEIPLREGSLPLRNASYLPAK